jgi:SAM-dependent methyltransferase
MRSLDDLLRATAKAEATHFWFRGFRAFVRPFIQEAVAGIRSPRILDCGCGTGANVEWLGGFGATCGFDLSEVGLHIARERGPTRLARASVTAVPFRGELFDLVTSFDVLYSLDQPDEHAAVAEMRRVLKPGGRIVVNVAAMKGLAGNHSVFSHERRRYTRASLRRLLIDNGFLIERLTYTNGSLFVPLAIIRAAQRWRGLSSEKEAQDITVPAAPINAALGALLQVESVWLRRFDEPFGSSLLCLARKPERSGC